MRRIFRPKRGEVIDGWRKFLDEDFRNLYVSSYYYDELIKKGGIGGACNTHRTKEKRTQNFGRKTLRTEPSWKT
jgi:hypothetical protein